MASTSPYRWGLKFRKLLQHSAGLGANISPHYVGVLIAAHVGHDGLGPVSVSLLLPANILVTDTIMSVIDAHIFVIVQPDEARTGLGVGLGRG